MKKYIFLVVAAIAALCSCSKDDDSTIDGVVAWEYELSMGKFKDGVTRIVIETGINTSSYASDATHKPLNAAGTLWEVLDDKVLRIQTSGSKILGHDSFVREDIHFGLFSDYYKVETISGIENLDMSKVTNMSNLFANCQELTSIDISGFDNHLVDRTDAMFENCFKLKSITGLEKLNTSNVTKMDFMFANCKALTELDLSTFNTSNVTRMFFMFAGCDALTKLDLSSFNTSKVTYMESMFENCSKLSSLTFGASFSMAKVVYKQNMFSGCGSDGHCYVRGITDPALKDALRDGTGWDEANMEFK